MIGYKCFLNCIVYCFLIANIFTVAFPLLEFWKTFRSYYGIKRVTKLTCTNLMSDVHFLENKMGLIMLMIILQTVFTSSHELNNLVKRKIEEMAH